MMRANFDRALAFTLSWEGGYVHHPNDPGGETKFGISKRAYPDLDIASLTREQAAAIYRRDYWDRCGCDELASGLDVAVFDTAVNLGASRALRLIGGWWSDLLLRRVEHYVALAEGNGKFRAFLFGWLRRTVALARLCREITGET